MRILVLGAGVVGAAAAYYLARDGHEVTVIERHPSAAQGTSYSNAGLVSPGDATAWASPAALKTFLQSLYKPGLGIKVRPGFDPYFVSWSLRFLAQCSQARCRANTDVKLRLALYSRACMDEISAETGIEYDQRSKGVLYFFRSQQSLDGGASNLRYLAEHGLKIELVDRNRLVELEPGLAGAKEKIAGGVYSPMDQTGDSHLFVQGLTDWSAAKLGVKFLFDTTIQGLDIEGGRVRAVNTTTGPVTGDAVVISLGPESGLLGRKYGIDLPVYPVKGYTATLPLPNETLGPTMGGVDEDRLIAYSRLGSRLRLASTAEFAGFDRSYKRARFRRAVQDGKGALSGRHR